MLSNINSRSLESGMLSGLRKATLKNKNNKDAFFFNVRLLLRFNGDFKDNSLLNKTVSVIGDPVITSSITKYGGGAARFINGSGYLSVPSNNNYVLGTADFTIESWLYFDLVGTQTRGIVETSTGTTTNGFVFRSDNGTLRFLNNTTILVGGSIVVYRWYHVAVSRKNGVFRLFLDGKLVNSNTTVINFTNASDIHVGKGFRGNMDDFRFTTGVCRYTEDFKPPKQLQIK